jgi:hypothetical protein
MRHAQLSTTQQYMTLRLEEFIGKLQAHYQRPARWYPSCGSRWREPGERGDLGAGQRPSRLVHAAAPALQTASRSRQMVR